MTNTQKEPYDIRASAQDVLEEKRKQQKDHFRQQDLNSLRDRRRVVIAALKKLRISIADCELVDLTDRDRWIGIVRYDGLTWGINVDGWFTFVFWDQGQGGWHTGYTSLPMFSTLEQLGECLEMIDAGVKK